MIKVRGASAAWIPFAASILVVAGVLVSFAPATRSLASVWLNTDETTYTHGFLIASISLWLLWRAGNVRAGAPLSAARAASFAFLMLGMTLLWELCYRAGIQEGFVVLLPALLWVALLLVRGEATARASSFAIGFLYFAIPIWDYLNGIAQASTVFAVRSLLRLSGVPSFFSGNFVQIPAGMFEIAGGCSGLHFIMVALAVAALLGELRGDGWRGRLKWLAWGLLLAVLTNWLRVYTIILAGHLTHMQHYIVRVSHYGYGWALFSLALVVLFLIERRAPLPVSKANDPADNDAAMFAAPPVVIATIFIAALPALFHVAIDSDSGPDRATASLLPAPAGWRAEEGESGWQPVQREADAIERQRFRHDSTDVEMVVASYARLAQGKELGGFGNRPAGDAEIIASERHEHGGQVVSEQRVATATGESLVWIEYRVGSRSFANAALAQLWYSWQTLRHLRPMPASVRLWHTDCRPDCGAARAVLNRFLDASRDSA
jgi:exosortase